MDKLFGPILIRFEAKKFLNLAPGTHINVGPWGSLVDDEAVEIYKNVKYSETSLAIEK